VISNFFRQYKAFFTFSLKLLQKVRKTAWRLWLMLSFCLSKNCWLPNQL